MATSKACANLDTFAFTHDSSNFYAIYNKFFVRHLFFSSFHHSLFIYFPSSVNNVTLALNHKACYRRSDSKRGAIVPAERGENKVMKNEGGLGWVCYPQSPLNFLCSLSLVRPPPLSESLEQAMDHSESV